MDIYFMRHGETDYNKQGLIQGRTDIPLNELGLSQAKEAGEYLKNLNVYFDKVYSSPLQRAKHTAAIVSGCDMSDIIVDERVQELGFGAIEGKDFRKIDEGARNLFFNPEKYVLPEGAESLDELNKRSRSFLGDLLKLAEQEPEVQTVLVASHGAALRGMVRALKNSPVEELWIKGLANCAFIHVRLEDGQYTILETVSPLASAQELKTE